MNVRDEDRAGTHAHMRCRELAAVLGVAFGEACGAMALLRAEDGTGLPRCRSPWAVRLGGMGRGPWGAGGGGFFCFVFTFYFSNFALVFYLYAHLFLFYKIHTKAPKLM